MTATSIRKYFRRASACLAVSISTSTQVAKASVDPSEPIYARLLESYDTAKDAYNRLLDEIEAPSFLWRPRHSLPRGYR